MAANDGFSLFEGLAQSATQIVSQGALSSVQGSLDGALGSISTMLAAVQSSIVQIRVALLAVLLQMRLNLVGALASVSTAAVGVLRGALSSLFDGVGNLFRGALSFFSSGGGSGAIFGAVRGLIEGVAGAFGAVVSFVARGIPALGGLIVRAVQTLYSVITGVFRVASTVAQVATAPIRAGIGFVASAVRFVFKTVYDLVVGTITSTIQTAIQSALASGRLSLSSLLSIGSTIVSGIGAMLGTVATYLAPIVILIVGAIGTVLVAAINRVLNIAVSALSAVARAVTNVITTLGPVLINAISTVWNAMRTGLSTAATFAKSTFATLSSYVTGVWSWVTGLASTVGKFISSGGGGAFAALSSVFSNLVEFGGALLRFVPAASVLGAFGLAVAGAAKAALDYARNVQSLNSFTGLGMGQSASLINRFGAQGVGAQALQGVFQNQSPFALNLKAQAFGLPSFESAGFAEALTRRFQSLNNGGPIQQIMGQNLLKTLGLDSAAFRDLVSTSPRTQRENAAFGNRINASLGLSPQALEAYSEQIPASLNRIGNAFQAIGLKLASVALPLVEKVVGGLADFIGNNAPQIAAALERLTNWITGSILPVFLSSGQTLVQMGIQAFNGFVNWATWFVNNIEQILGNASQFISTTLGNWSTAFSQWGADTTQAFSGFLSNLGQRIGGWISGVGNFIGQQMINLGQFMGNVFSNSNNPFRMFVLSVANGLDALVNAGRDFIGMMASLSAAFNNILVLNPAAQAWNFKQTGQFIPWQSPSAAAAAATQGIGTSNLGGMAQRAFASPQWSYNGMALINAGNNFQQQSGQAGRAFTEAMGGLATSVANAGNSLTGAISGALAYGSRLTGPGADGRNPGQNIGQALAENVAPYVEGLQGLRDGIESITGALGENGRRQGGDRQSGEMLRVMKEIRDGLTEQTGVLRDIGVGTSPDVVAGIVISEWASGRASALRRR